MAWGDAQYHIFILGEAMGPVDASDGPSFGSEVWVWAADESNL